MPSTGVFSAFCNALVVDLPHLPSTVRLDLLALFVVTGLTVGLLGLTVVVPPLCLLGFLSLDVPVIALTNSFAYASTSFVKILASSLLVPKPNSIKRYVRLPRLA